MNFQIWHLSTLSKYAGISFIAGAVNHGMFSEQRSFVTAALGVLFFVVGAFAENRSQGGGALAWGDVIGFGILASIGLGLFTGGLQHFPDTPQRSAWVVPLGFSLSLISLHLGNGSGRGSTKALLWYALVGGAVVVAASAAALWLFGGTPARAHGHDGGGAHHRLPEIASAPVSLTDENATVRNVLIDMDDSLRFTPARWEATEGEALRLVLINSGKVRHELVIGREKELAEHAKLMREATTGHHHHDNALTVEPGQAAVLRWSFKAPGTWSMACFEHGHFEAGMAGQIVVAAKRGH